MKEYFIVIHVTRVCNVSQHKEACCTTIFRWHTVWDETKIRRERVKRRNIIRNIIREYQRSDKFDYLCFVTRKENLIEFNSRHLIVVTSTAIAFSHLGGYYYGYTSLSEHVTIVKCRQRTWICNSNCLFRALAEQSCDVEKVNSAGCLVKMYLKWVLI